MAGKTAEATFRINIDGNAAEVSERVSVSARKAAKSIGDYENEIKALSSDLRRLRGNSADVVAAKTALRKRIDEAKGSVSSLTAELTKQGTSYAAAAAAAKKYGDSAGKFPNLRAAVSKAIVGAGTKLGPVGAKLGKALDPAAKKLGAALAPLSKRAGEALAPVTSRLGKSAKVVGAFGKAVKQDLGSVLPSASTMLGVLATGTALATAAIVAAAAAAVGATAAFIGFGLAASNAAAKAQRQREALLGNADDARRLGDQIDALAGKVPQGANELHALGLELSKTRISGKALVDTMAAVAQASGAVDAAAGAKIQELVTRGQNTGRFALGRLELQGTGIDFEDVAKEYAAGTKKSIAAARAELAWGQAPLEKGAEALRKATEKKFGELNLKNAFSLDNAPKKFFDQFRSLVSVSEKELAPLTNALRDAFGQLSPDQPLGAAVRSISTAMIGGFAEVAGKTIPLVLEGFKWLMVGALKVGTIFYETKKKVKDAFEIGDWVGIGKAIISGIVKGILEQAGTVPNAVLKVAKMAKEAFTGPEGIDAHSPSRKFAKYGEHMPDGVVEGVERGAARARSAVVGMLDGAAPPAPAAAAPVSGGSETIEVHFHLGGEGQDAVATLQSPQFLAQVTRAIRDARMSSGLPARRAA